jgi:ParB family chromosome partitioning protein
VSTKRKGLGRGLDALLPPKREDGLQELELGLLKASPGQPRKQFDPEAIAELAASIAEKGVLQPLLVRPAAGGYEIVAGERRFRAAQQAGLSKVPAIVRSLSDQETLEIAIIENLQRENLNPVEEARAFAQLLDFGLSQEAVARSVGKSRSAVANTLRLLKLPEAALAALERGQLSAGHARARLAQPGADQNWALEQILSQGLSVRQAERLERKEAPPLRPRSAHAHAQLEHQLAAQWGTQVKIRGDKKGKVELYFYSSEDLERLLELLHYRT